MVEIYNDELRDLLGKGGNPSKHEIRHEERTRTTTVTGLQLGTLAWLFPLCDSCRVYVLVCVCMRMCVCLSDCG
jgi:hypothetical protein